MKKLMILAVAAIALAACSRTFDTHQATGQAIGFGTWSNVLTKTGTGRTIGGTAFTGNDYFFVYGYTSEAQTPFDGTKVSTTDGTNWTYNPIRYWDRNNSYYDFYAISPSETDFDAADDLVATHDVTDGTMETVSLTLAGNDNDILVADKAHVLKANYGTTAVTLNFRHSAALLDLKVRKGASLGNNGVLKVTAISLDNIDSEGTLEVTGYNAADHATAPNKAIIAWNATDTDSYTGDNGVKNTVNTDIISGSTEVTTAGDQFLINNLIVMPQTFRNSGTEKQQLTITYTITTGTGSAAQTNTFTGKTYDLVLFDKTDYDSSLGSDPDAQNANPRVSGWVDGVHYTYIITIDAEAITFNATMEGWGTDNGYYYILN